MLCSPDGSIRNAYTIKLRNMESRPRQMEVTLDFLARRNVDRRDAAQRGGAQPEVRVADADQTRPCAIYVIAPRARRAYQLHFRPAGSLTRAAGDTNETRFDAPGG
jgi:hypothetical protein